MNNTSALPHLRTSAERHPAGLYVLFAAEMWERFSFYTMVALLIYYMRDGKGGFNWASPKAAGIYANYITFVYVSPLIGGWIADRKLGFRRAVTIGATLMAVGYLLTAVPFVPVFYAALACIVIGNGFFKPNIFAMAGALYPVLSPLKDSAFNIIYIGINIGAFFAPAIADFTQSRWGFHAAFMISGAGMLISLGVLRIFGRRLEGADYARKPIENSAYIKGDVPTALIPDSHRIIGLTAIFAITAVFWAVFHQSGSAFAYWADSKTDWTAAENFLNNAIALVGGRIRPKIGIEISYALNPFFVVFLTFPLLWFWSKLRDRGLEPSTQTKIGCGMFLIGSGFGVMVLAAKQLSSPETLVSFWWLLIAFAVVSLGELCVGPMGLSLVTKVAPPNKQGLLMGGWFAATGVGNLLSGVLGAHWPKGGPEAATGAAIWSYETFFLVCAVSAVVMGAALFVALPSLKRVMPEA